MCCLFKFLCSCCSDSSDLSSKKKRNDVKQRTRTASPEKKVNLAVMNASTVSKLKTQDLTQVFDIPSNGFQTENDVVRSSGYQIDYNQVLGKGQYGTVYKGIFIKEKTVVATKVMTAKDTKIDYLNDAKNELFVMEKTSHPHIVKVFAHFIIKDSISHRNNVFIFMRFAENKSLSDYIRHKKIHFEEPSGKKVFAQIVSAVSHMHSLGIAHRDLKLGNVLLDNELNALVSDFGLSRVLYRQKDQKPMECYKRVGTIEYMAPEILVMETTKVPYDPFAADIWAMGVILYAMINRCYPFGSKPIKMIELQFRFEKWRSKVCKYYEASHDLDDIIRRIFRYHKEERIKMPELVKHNWIRNEIQSINDKIKLNSSLKIQ